MPGSSVAVRIADARLAGVSFLAGCGGGPAPARCTAAPQKCWSPWKGQTTVGRAASSPAAVVPAPPGWTTAATRAVVHAAQSAPPTGDHRADAGLSHRVADRRAQAGGIWSDAAAEADID